jgi:hypothetical protein
MGHHSSGWGPVIRPRSRIPVRSTTRVKSAIVFSLTIDGSGSLSAQKEVMVEGSIRDHKAPATKPGLSYKGRLFCCDSLCFDQYRCRIARDQRNSHEDRPSGRWPAIHCSWAFLVRTRDWITRRAAQCCTDRRRRLTRDFMPAEPRDDARQTVREFLDRYPKPAYMSEVEHWRELSGGEIEFTMRRLRTAV